jgi:hypothetical protein
LPVDDAGFVMAEFAVGDMIEALGWSGSALIVASLTLRRPGPFRAVNLASAVVLLAFNLAIGLWSMVVLNVAILAVNAWHLGRLVRRPPALDPAPPQEGWYIRTQAPSRRHTRDNAAASDHFSRWAD